jgi:iron complex outermembrane receptor protein
VNRFVSEPSFDRYQTETSAISSLFEHTFSEAFKVRQNMRYTHVEGIYNTMYPEQYFNDGANPNYPFLDATRRTVARWVSAKETTKDAFTSDSNAELKFATGPVSHKVLIGFDYRHLNENAASGAYVDTTPFDLYAPVYSGVTAPALSAEPRTLQTQSGVYAQDQLRFGPWIAVLGLRHDQVTSDVEGSPVQQDQATTGRAALMYELPFGLVPYVSYAQSFNPIFGGGICASLCAPQRGEQVEVGFKYQPSKTLAINGALYDTTEKNRLASDPTNPLISAQTGEVRIRGAELEVLAGITPYLDIIGAYAYTDAKLESGDNAGKRVETVPLHQASLWAKYRLDAIGLHGVTIGAGARYIGDSWDGTDTIKTPDYTLFDAMLRYENGPWRWQINATNLADKQHVTTCLARGDCFYGIGRTVLTSLTYRF